MAAAAQESGMTAYVPASASGRRWAFGFGIVVMLATTIPYWLAFQSQGDAWLFRSPYTPMPQSGVVAYLPYILLGRLAAPPGMHDQLVIIYHLVMLNSVERFYRDDTLDSERLSLLDKYHIAYVFYGPAEAALGSWEPARAEYLEELIALQGYSVYRVISASDGPSTQILSPWLAAKQ